MNNNQNGFGFKDANTSTKLTIVLAVLCTATSLLMVIFGGWFAGESNLGIQSIWIAYSVVFCIGSHALLSITHNLIGRILWLICVVATVINIMFCFDYMTRNADELHIKKSVTSVGLERQIGEINNALNHISARPIAIIEQELVSTVEWRKRSVLSTELAEAKRAASMHFQLVGLLKDSSAAIAIGATDTVYAGIGKMIGLNPRGIQLSVELSFALLLELLGAYLWKLIFSTNRLVLQAPEVVRLTEPFVIADDLDLNKVRKAISSGDLKMNVNQVRKFLSCSQAKAQDICRILKAKK
jgi:hypothetical protein